LGTSDTYFGYLTDLKLSDESEGHIFGTADGGYMALLCFKNGGLARAKIKDRFGLSWGEFSHILLNTPPGNEGRIMLPYFFPEITPLVLQPTVHRFGGLNPEDKEGNIRAVAEGQIMSMYLHSAWMGQRPRTILVTAGGSENAGLLKVISDIFDAEVLSFEVKDSAALGAAVRAAHCYLNTHGKGRSWKELTDLFVAEKVVDAVQPDKDAVRIYGADGLLGVYDACEKFALGAGDDPETIISRFRKEFYE
jgi:xylulokinase